MKIVFVLMFSLLMSKGCNKQSLDLSQAAVEYTAMTRGYQLSVVAREPSAFVVENKQFQSLL
ncbi:MAG: hypothetical protein EOP48_07445 [Sphingobacteriales bacterium]|nr:MAG: hypothetical protein EOP48_07445 [Sphingobacteriales bacterium]